MTETEKLQKLLSWAPHLSPSEILVALHVSVGEDATPVGLPMTIKDGAAATGAHEIAICNARAKMVKSGLLHRTERPKPGNGARLWAFKLNWDWPASGAAETFADVSA